MELKTNPPSVAQNIPAAEAVMKLPIQILTKADVSRLGREMDSLETFFTASALRAADAKALPQVTQQLTVLLNENKLNILSQEDRLKIRNFLKYLHDNAPIVHASFAADPKPDFLMRIAGWFREQAHPNVLLQIGLQPGLAAGCIFRTTNKYFDFSFKKHFETDKAKLIASLKGQA